VATDSRPRYAPELDGLRAVSVAAVAYSHWLPAWQFGVPLGAGVHLFFVLSGFLITRILLDLRAADDRLAALGRFTLRRVLRLWPAFYVVLALAWMADVPLAAETWPWHAGYLSNLYIAWQGAWQGHFSHLWSLAVEQQFYLLWPVLVVWTPARLLPAAIAGAVLLGPVSHGVAAAIGVTEPFWALVPLGSADSLAAGAAVAWLHATDGRWRASQWPRTAAIAGAAGWLGLTVLEVLSGAPAPPGLAVWRQVLQAAVFAWVVSSGVRGIGGGVGTTLRHPAAVAVGRVSYGIYLVHPFAPLVLDAVLTGVSAPPSSSFGAGGRAAAAWGTTLVLATLLWHLVEAPWQRLRPGLDADRR